MVTWHVRQKTRELIIPGGKTEGCGCLMWFMSNDTFLAVFVGSVDDLCSFIFYILSDFKDSKSMNHELKVKLMLEEVSYEYRLSIQSFPKFTERALHLILCTIIQWHFYGGTRG